MSTSDKKEQKKGQSQACDWCGFEVNVASKLACTQCGAPNPEGVRHCHHCGVFLGVGIGDESPALVGGAVVFVSLEGIGTVAAHSGKKLGPALSLVTELVEEIATGHNGEWEGNLGTYQLFFESFNDDHSGALIRAVRGVMQLQQRLDDALQTLAMEGVILAPLFAIHFGKGLIVREGTHWRVLPESKEVGQQLLGIGSHYNILVSEAVAESLGASFLMVPVDEGLGRHQHAAFRLDGEALSPPGVPLWQGEGSSVGRDRECDFLTRRWRNVVAGEGAAIMTVVGASGSGRRRVVEEFVLSVIEDDKVHPRIGVGSAQIEEGGTDSQVFGVMAQALLRFIGCVPGDGNEEVKLRLLYACRVACRALDLMDGARQAKQMAALLTPFLGLAWSTPETARLDPVSLRENAFFALVRLIDGYATAHPGLLVLENLDEADGLSIAFLHHLGQANLTRGRLMVVVTATPELFNREEDWGKAYWHHEVLRLAPLQAEALIELSVGLVARHGTLSDWVLEELLDKADGDAYMMEQLTLLAITRGAGPSTEKASDTTSFDDEDDMVFDEDHGEEGGDGGWPSDIVSLLAQRLAHLAPSHQGLLSLMAMMDEPFTQLDLEALWRADRRNLGELRQSLQVLEVQGFIRRRVCEFGWRFRGGKLRHLLRSRLSEVDRSHWGRRIARHLENGGARDRFLSPFLQIAQSYREGGLEDVAIRYFALAGTKARRLGAPTEGEAALHQARDLADSKRAAHKPGLSERIALLLTRGSLNVSLNRIPEGLEDLEAAREMAKIIDDKKWAWNVELVLAEAYDAQGLLSRAESTFDTVIDGSSDPRQKVRALRRGGWLRFRQGDNDAAQSFIKTAWEVAKAEGLDLRQLSQALDDLGIAAWMSGDQALALRASGALLEHLQRTFDEN